MWPNNPKHLWMSNVSGPEVEGFPLQLKVGRTYGRPGRGGTGEEGRGLECSVADDTGCRTHSW